MSDSAICKHCRKPKSAHGTSENPIRAFACPGLREPSWPRSIKDEARAGQVFDKRLAKFWTQRKTSFQESA